VVNLLAFLREFTMAENILYYGDNLEILRRYIKNESVDLVYLDPPFKSDQDYNILFAERNGSQAAAQIKAFEDTWHWDKISAAPTYGALNLPSQKVKDLILDQAKS
jgi:site-specific DNA-methyltransferase (adenine-specific)